MTVRGIDLSNWQRTTPDLSPYGFVFNKCTESNNYFDPTYDSRHSLTRNLGKIFGAYHFFHTQVSVAFQASWFVKNAKIEPGDIVALDFENDGTWSQFNNAQLADLATQMMRALRAAYPTNRVLLYCNHSTYQNVIKPNNVPLEDGLWDADYTSTQPSDPFVIWQYTDTPVDGDVATAWADQAAMQAWVGGIDDMQLTDTWTDPQGNPQTVQTTLDRVNFLWFKMFGGQEPSRIAGDKNTTDGFDAIMDTVASVRGSVDPNVSKILSGFTQQATVLQDIATAVKGVAAGNVDVNALAAALAPLVSQAELEALKAQFAK